MKRILVIALLCPGLLMAEPLASVNNFVTSDAVFNVLVDPLDGAGQPIVALRQTLTWTFQQQTITATFPASPTPYTFTGLHIWYRVGGGTGVKPVQWGAFDHVQAARNVPADIALNCIYGAPPIGMGDLTCTLGPDTVPPTAPGSLAAASPSTSTINLTWLQATDNVGVASYSIERCQGVGCADFGVLGSSTVLAFGESNLTSGQTYSYRARAVDVAGNVSGYSNTATATVLVPPPPPPPPPAFTTPGTKMPPATKIVDKDGATWTLMPLVGGVAGQTGAARNGVRKSNSVEFVTIDKTGVVWQSDFKSGAGWDRWNGTDWLTTGAVGPVF